MNIEELEDRIKELQDENENLTDDLEVAEQRVKELQSVIDDAVYEMKIAMSTLENA